MHFNSRPKCALLIVLSISLVATGCSAQWIRVALADLPILGQMALNLGTLVTTLDSGKPLSTADTTAIQNISAEAGKDLSLLQTLYNEYKTSPSDSTIQKIQNTITELDQNLPALLQAAHISDPVLSAKVTAGVNLILTTVDSFAALIPQTAQPASAQTKRATVEIPPANDLKKQWNEGVCGSVQVGCAVK